jgi:hypothetical protein
MHDTIVLFNAIRVAEIFFAHPPKGELILVSCIFQLFDQILKMGDDIFYKLIGKYYVVDAGSPNRPGYLCPYKGERYHMPEWNRGIEPKTPKERFNCDHSGIRNVIERSFGVLKMK